MFTVFALPQGWLSMVKSAFYRDKKAIGNRDPARLPRQIVVFDDFIGFDTVLMEENLGNSMRQISG